MVPGIEHTTSLNEPSVPTRVLIVEDERIIAYDLRVRLQHLGYYVVDVLSQGSEAIACVQSDQVDLVLMDVVIDGELDGIDTALAIQQIADIPIVFLTAFSDDKTFERARKLDQFAYVLKPFQERELNITIQTLLQKHRLERKVRQSEQQYRSLFEHTLEAVLILDDEGNIQDLNQAARKLLGNLHHDKDTIFSLFPTAGKPYIRKKFAELLETGSAFGRFRLTFSGNTKRHLYLELRLQANLYPGLHIAQLNDASARVEAERKIKELARTSSDSPHPIIRLSLQGEVIYFNKAALQFVFHWGNNFITEIPPRLQDLINVTAQGKPVKKLIYKLKRKTYSVRLVYVPDGRYINFYATDITSLQHSKSLISAQRDALEQIARGRPITVLAKLMAELLQRTSMGAKVAFVGINQQAEALYPIRQNNQDYQQLAALVMAKYGSVPALLSTFLANPKGLILTAAEVSELIEMLEPGVSKDVMTGLAIYPIMAKGGDIEMFLCVRWRSHSPKTDQILGLMRMVTNVMSVAIERDRNVRTLSNQALLFGNINDSVVILDAQGRIIDWNLSSHKLFGYTRDQALNQTIESLGLLPTGPAGGSLANASAPLFDEVVFTTISGHTGYAELSLVPMSDVHNEPIGSMCLFRDITIRKKYEDQIRTSEANLTSLIENTDDLVCSVNLRGNLLTTNSAFEKFILQISGEKAMTADNLLSVLPSRVAAELDGYVRRALEGEKLMHEFVLQFDQADEIVLETSFNPMRDVRGKIEGASIFARNVTQRKLAEDELKRTNFELDSFVYRASHDLRAPMRSILGLLNLMEIDKSEASLNQYIGLVRTSINKLDNFIADLTHYSRNSRTAIEPESVNFLQIIDDCLENLKYMDRASRVKIYTDIYGNSAFFSDSGRLAIVFQNLISNAIKYQDLEKTDPFLKIRVSSGLRNAQILIEDNGKGIKQEFLTRIFDMFFRASDESYGSGLGLYITKQVIEKLGGTLAVNSEFGKGTTFAITIPNLNNEAGPDERKSTQASVTWLTN